MKGNNKLWDQKSLQYPVCFMQLPSVLTLVNIWTINYSGDLLELETLQYDSTMQCLSENSQATATFDFASLFTQGYSLLASNLLGYSLNVNANKHGYTYSMDHLATILVLWPCSHHQLWKIVLNRINMMLWHHLSHVNAYRYKKGGTYRCTIGDLRQISSYQSPRIQLNF